LFVRSFPDQTALYDSGLAPDVPVELASKEFMAGADPFLDAVLKYKP